MGPRWLALTWRTRSRPYPRVVRYALGVHLLVSAGCGTDAVGIDACRQIEEARCQQAPACGITLEPPYRTSGTDVTECIRFYDDACLHGLAVGHDPGPTAVSACVAAVRSASATGNCAVVANPASVAACTWLGPNAATNDGASSSDGGAEVGAAE